MMSSDVPAPMNPSRYVPDEIILYGVLLNSRVDERNENEAAIPCFDKYRLSIKVREDKTNGASLKNSVMAIAAIYGYSFEGHCYRFDRPKLMVFPGGDAVAEGCGFFGPDYRMWRISKRDEMLELNTASDLAEALVLEANLPGNKPPNTYGNSMQLGHRSGRLSRSNGNSS